MPAKITILSLYYKRRLVHKAAIVKRNNQSLEGNQAVKLSKSALKENINFSYSKQSLKSHSVSTEWQFILQ